MTDYFNFTDYTLNQTIKYLQESVNTKYCAEDITNIFEALKIAQNAHKHQVRIDNLPFILHPMRVALMLLQFDRNVTSRVFIAALLHDVLEDNTSVTREMIEEKFGRYTARLVQSVTRSCKRSDDPQKKLDDKRKNWEEVVCADHEVRAIKTFEDLDIMLRLKFIPEQASNQQKISHWLKEAREMSFPLARATNLRAFEIMEKAYKIMPQESRDHVTYDDVKQPVTI